MTPICAQTNIYYSQDANALVKITVEAPWYNVSYGNYNGTE